MVYTWDSFWAYFLQIPWLWRDQARGEKVQADLAKRLHLEEWLRTLSPKAQADVLLKAPESVVTFLFFKKVVTAETIGKLVKSGKKVQITDKDASRTKDVVYKSGYKSIKKKKG